MKKTNILLFSALMLLPFLSSAQNFPLLNSIYSYNCNGDLDESTYWIKTSDGKILKYSLELDGSKILNTKQIIEKNKIIDNKIFLELGNKAKQVTQYDELVFGPNGSTYRTIERAFGNEKFITNGRFIEANEETRSLTRCGVGSSVANLAIPKIRELLMVDDPNRARGEIIDPRLAKSPVEKCYLNVQGDQIIDSCDANVIKNSLAGYNRAILWKFKNASEIEFTAIYSNGEAKSFAEMTGGKVWDQIRTNSQSYKLNGNLITREIPTGSGCFITLTVEEKNGYRKEFFKSASPTCDSARVGANKLVSEGLRSGKDKGDRIINQ